MADEALALLAGMVLDNGRRWGECAAPEQVADARAFLSPAGPRRHMWLRARGRSKTLDAAGLALAGMLAGTYRAGDELYAAAADRDQARLAVRKIDGLVDRSKLRRQVKVDGFKVTVPATGAVLEVLAADAASSWGLTPRLLLVDEFTNWPATDNARAFVEALLTALPKNPASVAVLFSTPSSPTHWAHALYQTALAEPRLWRVSTHAGPAPWQSVEELAAERRRLPESLYRRLYAAEWVAADDVLTSLEAVRSCVRRGNRELPPRPGNSYAIGVDLSVTSDYTVVAVVHAERNAHGDPSRLIVDRLRVWKPSRANPIRMADVEQYIVEQALAYDAQVVVDPYQAAQLIQRLQHARVRAYGENMTAASNTRRALLLHRLLTDAGMSIPDDDELVLELASLALRETTPGSYRLETTSKVGGHRDRATAISLAAERVMSSSQGDAFLEAWRQMAAEQRVGM